MKKIIIKELKQEIVKNGLFEYVEYAALVGGYILSGNTKSDLDLIIVLKKAAKTQSTLNKK